LVENIGISYLDLGKTYDSYVIEKVLSFLNAKGELDFDYLIVDGSKLRFINVMGDELFILNRLLAKEGQGGVLFCGLTETMKKLIEGTSKAMGYGLISHFSSVSDAKSYTVKPHTSSPS